MIEEVGSLILIVIGLALLLGGLFLYFIPAILAALSGQTLSGQLVVGIILIAFGGFLIKLGAGSD